MASATGRHRPVHTLARYRAKRDFTRTPEPAGRGTRRVSGDLGFVVQAHAARRMHYDFRLELEGVLLSWSVPKGPSLSPGERRLALRTEDHPLDYADFEGIIPAGQYGGGTVAVWDRGWWHPEGDPAAGLREGRLTFSLDGEKLHGRWHLVRTRLDDGKRENWLLFKGRDQYASDERDLVAERPESVLTGRTLEEVAAAADAVWQSNRAEASHQRAPETNRPEAHDPGAAGAARHREPEPSRHEAHAPGASKVAPGATRGTTQRDARATSEAGPRRARGTAPPTAPSGEISPAAPDDLISLVKSLPVGFALTNLDRVLYPEQGVTKAMLLAYLAVAADWILPHAAGRPLTLVRCPDGTRKPCFYQKHAKDGRPPSIGSVDIPEDDGTVAHYMRIDDLAGLIGLAQLGALEFHIWGCRADKLERPDQMVFDLDPDPALPWARTVEAARHVRQRLAGLGLVSFVKTTGGKGLHVTVPLTRRLDWVEHKAFAKAVADQIADDDPASYTTNPLKARRRGRIFVDYLRNGRGATFIAPYSPRARAGATVATPVTWEELEAGIDPNDFTIATVPARLASLRADPWAGIHEVRQAITAAARRTFAGRTPARRSA